MRGLFIYSHESKLAMGNLKYNGKMHLYGGCRSSAVGFDSKWQSKKLERRILSMKTGMVLCALQISWAFYLFLNVTPDSSR